MSEKDLVQVAKLGKVVGLKGYIKLHNLSDFPSQFKKGVSFFTQTQGKILTLKAFNKANSTALFEGYEDIETSRQLTNSILYQSIEQSRKSCKLQKDEYFYFDILKCELCDSKQRLGKIVDILESSAGFLFEIQSDEELVKKGLSKSFFVPYIDKYILKVELENFKILCSDETILILENS